MLKSKRAVWMAVVSLVAGCQGAPDSLPTVPATGTVTYKGQPVEGAVVTFVARSAEAKAASGRTDQEGKFKLTTYVAGSTMADGAVPGEYAVIVTKVAGQAPTMPKLDAEGKIDEESLRQMTGGAMQMDPDALTKQLRSSGAGDSPEGPPAGGSQMYGQTKSLLPERYGSPTDTPLTAAVQEGQDNTFQFELTDG